MADFIFKIQKISWISRVKSMIGFSEIHNLTEKLESKKLFAVELWKFFIEWTRIELFWSVFFVDMQKVNFIKYIPLFLTLKVTALCARQCVYLVVPNLAASTKQRLCHSARQPQQPQQWGRWVLVDLTRKRTRRGDADGGTARRPARCAGSSCLVRGGSCAHLAPRAWRRLAVVLGGNGWDEDAKIYFIRCYYKAL